MDNQLPAKDDSIRLSPQGYVMLPFQENEFKDFIKGLLGKPQTINAVVKGTYEIVPENIADIYTLLNQRVEQQNNGKLIQFNADLVFDNESTLGVTSIEELISYKEIRTVIPIELHIQFIYLTTFSQKQVPERQEINLSFVPMKTMKKRRSIRYTTSLLFPLRSLEYMIKGDEQFETESNIQYEIKTTDRTWAFDIENIIRNYIDDLLIDETPIRKFINKNIDRITNGAFLSIITIGCYFIYRVYTKAKDILSNELDETFKNSSLQDITSQLRYMFENTKADASIYIIPVIVITAVAAFFTKILIEETVVTKRNSHILFSKNAILKKEKDDEIYSKSTLKYFVFLFISILCSVAANFVYDWMVK